MKHLLLLLLLASPALAQEAIPFRVEAGRYITIPVTIQGPGGTVSIPNCYVDTAATELWLGRGYWEQLGLTWHDGKYPSAYVKLSVGSLYHERQAAYGWNALSDRTCLIGADRFWSWQTLWDFSRGLIIREPEIYWYQHWSACQTTVYQLWHRVRQCEAK